MQLLNDDLNLLGLWCKVNKLTINVEKSKCMLFVAPLSKFKDLKPESLPALYLGHLLRSLLRSPTHQLHIVAKLLPLRLRRKCYELNILNRKLIKGMAPSTWLCETATGRHVARK